MSTMTDSDFWLNEADHEIDICDSRLTADDFLSHIIPEIPRVNDKIVEIGCGIGRLTSKIEKKFTNSEIIGIDINDKFLDIARGRSNCKYLCSDSLNGLHDVDFIYSVLVFQHLDSRSKSVYIMEASRALRDGGVLLFQYVEGDHSSRAMYDANINHIRAWCFLAGLTIEKETFDLVCDRWTWIKAVKRV